MPWGHRLVQVLRDCVGIDHPEYEHAIEELTWLQSML